MNKSHSIRAFWSVILIVAAGAAWSAVTSPLLQVEGTIGSEVTLPLNLSAEEAVAGVSGQLVYDTDLIQDPTIEASAANSAFSVLGKDVSNPGEPGVGRFNFVIFADPTISIDLGNPAANFSVRIANDVGDSSSTTLAFGAVTASDSAANALTTDLAGFEILFQTAANHWARYR